VVKTIEVSGEKNWMLSVPLTGLPAGTYTVEAWLTNTGQRSFSGSVGFEVSEPK
jgi:hypothetical protein